MHRDLGDSWESRPDDYLPVQRSRLVVALGKKLELAVSHVNLLDAMSSLNDNVAATDFAAVLYDTGRPFMMPTKRLNLVHRGVARVALVLCSAASALGTFGVVESTPASAATVAAVRTALIVSVPQTSSFCTYAKTATSNFAESATSLSPSALAADYSKYKAAEPIVLSKVPAQYKGDFQTIFAFSNKFFEEVAAAKYNFLKLSPSYLLSLAKSEKSVAAASKAITIYLAKTCGIKS